MSNVDELVAKGIALLDEKGPEGWRDRIDLDELDVSGGCTCVLAQVYGTYGRGCTALRMASTGCPCCETGKDQAHDFGFNDTCDISYDQLTAAWRAALKN